MIEKKFLLYLLYITLIEIRSESYETGNNKFFWLADILHKVPLEILNEGNLEETYQHLKDSVKHLGVDDWLEMRKREFYNKYPELADKLN